MARPTAAESLLGLTLSDGWTVAKRLEPRPAATGGYYSVGYLVRKDDGTTGFLKAIDFARAFDENETPEGEDLIRILQHLTGTYDFERAILQKCRELRLSRVATAISDGSVLVPGFEPLHRVFYLIFELADGDVRAHLDRTATIEVVWCLTTLHQVATGIKQLHWNEIALRT